MTGSAIASVVGGVNVALNATVIHFQAKVINWACYLCHKTTLHALPEHIHIHIERNITDLTFHL